MVFSRKVFTVGAFLDVITVLLPLP